jgi:glycosyltransferase involved in cell wall biosynthesis
MRVGINARYLSRDPTGIEIYLRGLLRGLVQEDRSNEYVLFTGPPPLPDLGPLGPNFRVRPSAIPFRGRIPRAFWEYLWLAREIRQEGIEVFHGPSFLCPLIKNCAWVSTIHDVAFAAMPEVSTGWDRAILGTFLSRTVRRAERILCDSEWTQKDVARIYGVPPDRLAVIYPGRDESWERMPPEEVARNLSRMGVPTPYFLHVSRLQARKNPDAIMHGWSRSRRKIPERHSLVIVGTDRAPPVEGLTDDVIFLGRREERDLRALYQGSVALVFPSIYEGFGFPVLEAFSLGTPVIASRATSLPEVAGEAAILVDPGDRDGLAEAMVRLATDEDLRADLSRRGEARAREFSWRPSARKVLQAYREAHEEHQGR